MPHQSFTVGGPSNAEPITFDLNGTDQKGQAIAPIKFYCVPAVQGMEMINLYQEDQMAAGKSAIDLITKAIVEEQADLWHEVTTGKDIIVAIETLGNIAKYLLGVYSKNPPSAPSGSTPGPQLTGPTSMADYLSAPEPTLQPSPPIVSSTPPIQ